MSFEWIYREVKYYSTSKPQITVQKLCKLQTIDPFKRHLYTSTLIWGPVTNIVPANAVGWIRWYCVPVKLTILKYLIHCRGNQNKHHKQSLLTCWPFNLSKSQIVYILIDKVKLDHWWHNILLVSWEVRKWLKPISPFFEVNNLFAINVHYLAHSVLPALR